MANAKLRKRVSVRRGKASRSPVAAVVLAAGDGTRMLSQIPKVLHALYGKPLIGHVLDAVGGAGVSRIVVVVGYQSDLVKKQLSHSIQTVVQSRLKGTADAVLKAKQQLKSFSGDLIVLYGDTPLITPETVRGLLKTHREQDAACTVLTATLREPTGYGRIIRDQIGGLIRIIEDVDATPVEKAIEEINAGAYCFKARKLFEVLKQIRPAPNGEYYLTDAIELLVKQGETVASASTRSVGEFLGINSRADLARVQTVMRARVLEEFMLAGVTIVDPTTTYIYQGAKIGQDTVVFPQTIIENDVTIGRGCEIGPFCRLGPGTRLADNVQLGSFVETSGKVQVGSGATIQSGNLLQGPLKIKAKTVVNHNLKRAQATLGVRRNGHKGETS